MIAIGRSASLHGKVPRPSRLKWLFRNVLGDPLRQRSELVDDGCKASLVCLLRVAHSTGRVAYLLPG
jgi:hypothetical protein